MTAHSEVMSFGRAIAPLPQERRSTPRTPLDCPARLRTCFGDRAGHLSDMSVMGARFVTADPPKEGTTALLEWEGHDSICRVVWTKPDACGLVFEPPLARHIVDKYAPPAVPEGPAEPPAELGRIAPGRRSSLRAVLLKGGGEA
jgi:hypothetical protein